MLNSITVLLSCVFICVLSFVKKKKKPLKFVISLDDTNLNTQHIYGNIIYKCDHV